MKPTFVATCRSPLMLSAWHPQPIAVYLLAAMRDNKQGTTGVTKGEQWSIYVNKHPSKILLLQK